MKMLNVQLQYAESNGEINMKEKLKEILTGSDFHLISLSDAENSEKSSAKNEQKGVKRDGPLRKHEHEGVDSDVESSGSGGMVSPN
jgi:hypothetical protein